MLAHRKRGRKGKKISGDGKYFFFEEKEKEENIWRGEKYSFLEGKLTTTDNWVHNSAICLFEVVKVVGRDLQFPHLC